MSPADYRTFSLFRVWVCLASSDECRTSKQATKHDSRQTAQPLDGFSPGGRWAANKRLSVGAEKLLSSRCGKVNPALPPPPLQLQKQQQRGSHGGIAGCEPLPRLPSPRVCWRTLRCAGTCRGTFLAVLFPSPCRIEAISGSKPVECFTDCWAPRLATSCLWRWAIFTGRDGQR